jgi:hypothetical protein
LEQLKESKEKDEAKAKEPEPIKRPKGRPKKEIVKTADTEEEASETDFHHAPKKSKPKKLRKQTKIIIDNDSSTDSDDDEPAIIIKTKKKKKKQVAPEPKPEQDISPHDMSPSPITDVRFAEVIPMNPVPPPPRRQPAWMGWH